MPYLKFLNENFGEVEEDPVYINTSKRKTPGNIGVVDDDDPKYQNHMKFLKNTLGTGQIKIFLRKYLNEKGGYSKDLENVLINMFRRYWNDDHTFEEFENVLTKKKLALNKTRSVKLQAMIKHAAPFLQPSFFEELFSLKIGKAGTSVGDGEIILWFLFSNLLNPPKKGDIVTTNGAEFEIKKAFGSTGFRFISQKGAVKWSQLMSELLELGELYTLNLPLIAAASTKSFTSGKLAELREQLINNKNNDLYRNVIRLFHPYRQFSDNEMSVKLNLFKTAIGSYEEFEDFLVSCQFYSYALLEGFEAIGFWMSPEILTIVSGKDLDSFEKIYTITRKYLTAHALWDSGRGPGQVKGK